MPKFGKDKPDLSTICHEFAKEWRFYEQGRDMEIFIFPELNYLAGEVGKL